MLLELLDEAVKGLKDAEVYAITKRSMKASAEDSKLKDASTGEVLAVAVRVERNKRLGFHYTSLPSLEKLKEAVRSAYEAAERVAKVSEEVPWWKGFPSSKCSPLPGLYSSSLAHKDLDYVIGLVKRVLEGADESLSVMVGASLRVETWALANTEGVRYEEKETLVSLWVGAAKKVNGYMTKVAWDTFSSRSQDPEAEVLAERVFDEAKRLKHKPERISGEYLVYFDPRATSEILDFLMDAFMASEVARGHSPLAGKLGERVFNEQVTISDNPALPGGVASHGCDEEGVRAEPLILVDSGKVNAYLGDLYWGYKVGFVGRGFREKPSTPPSPSYTNLALHTGKGAEGDVIVTGVTGLHTASSETGDMSVVLSPAWHKGEHVEAVLTVNVYDLFGELLEGVGKEGRWVDNIYTPGFSARVKLS